MDYNQDGLHYNYCPEYLPEDVQADVIEELREVEYNSDEDSMVMIWGKRLVIPRKQVAFGEPFVDGSMPQYRFSGNSVPAQPWPMWLENIRDGVHEYMVDNSVVDTNADPPNFVLLNLYRDGNDSIGWHRDDEKDLLCTDGGEKIIVSLTLGASRIFSFRRRSAHSMTHNIELNSGDLLIMRGTTNDLWEHSVPKRKKITTPRWNFTFRWIRP